MDSSENRGTKLKRAELYERIWKTPARKLAREFGLSDVGLAKVCKRHNVPRPSRGYWAKLAHGKRVRRIPLPPLEDADLEEVRIFRQQFFGLQNAAVDKPAPISIEVAETLVAPHTLVIATRRQLRAADKAADGTLIPNGFCLNVRVTKGSLDRAMRILDALIKHWEKSGGTVSVEKTEGGQVSTKVSLDEVGVPLVLTEQIDRIFTEPDARRGRAYRNCKYKPTGRLALQIDVYADGRRKWADGKRQTVESLLGPCVTGLMGILEQLRLKALDDQCVDRQRASVRKVREAAQKREELEEQRRKKLSEDLTAWKRRPTFAST